MGESVVSIVTAKTDTQLASEAREEITKALGPVVEIMNRAKLNGLSVTFNINADQYGRFAIKEIVVVKPL